MRPSLLERSDQAHTLIHKARVLIETTHELTVSTQNRLAAMRKCLTHSKAIIRRARA
jgi:hypothetical protein